MRFLPFRWAVSLLFAVLLSGPSLISATANTPTAGPEAAEVPQFNIRALGDYENQWFDVTMMPGTTTSLRALVQNSGNVPVRLLTYTTNATNPPNGGFSAGTVNEELIGPTLWIAYPTQRLELSPGEDLVVDFTVSVPADTPAGEYFAALVVQTAEPVSIPGTDDFQQMIRNTISVEITVPGDMTFGFELGQPEFSHVGDGWRLNVDLTNSGTARLRPEGRLVVATPDGEVVSTTDVEMGSIYGGNTTSVSVTLPGQMPAGDYLVSLDLTDEATGATASLENTPVTLAEPEVEEAPTFVIDSASVTPNADPVQYADVVATITNNGTTIPTANVTLTVMRDGEEVESYPLAQRQALPQGTTDFSQRYIPVDGWESGTYTFELIISAVSGDTETVLATVEIPDEITVP